MNTETSLSFKNLPVKSRDGNRVTYGGFIYVVSGGLIHVEEMVVEFPQRIIKNVVTHSEANQIVVEVTACAPRIVSVKFKN